MKSKATVFFLIIAVLAIWGVITLKIFSSFSVETTIIPVPEPKTDTIKGNDVLVLDYPDPFLKKQSLSYIPSDVPTIQTKNDKSPDKIKEVCDIKYIGYIRSDKTQTCIVEYRGSHHSIVVGELVDGFRLTNMCVDSIVFTKDVFSYTVVSSK